MQVARTCSSCVGGWKTRMGSVVLERFIFSINERLLISCLEVVLLWSRIHRLHVLLLHADR